MYKSGLTEAVCKLLPYNAQRFEHIRLYFCMLSCTDKVMFCSCHLKVLAFFIEKSDALNACSLSSQSNVIELKIEMLRCGRDFEALY